ncbi:AMP-binding protein [Naasia lichenicola]|uniref:Acyl-CoA synthetase n=1 Tax=Naasia lichenicola TaxID=2565933 RepID=A0A4S4FK39_9MICO|nr:AMP-binding protein [Naasia lichenicola]THG29526.1 acyl-CoA synthetase [Naasia lichenicola]
MRAHYADLWHRIALAEPDRAAIVTAGGSTLDYRTFDAAAARLAGLLHGRGMRAGDKLAILLHNRPEWLIAMYAALKLGVAPVALNFRYRSSEVAALLLDSDSTALVYPASLAKVVEEALVGLPVRPILLQVEDGPGALIAGALDFEQYLGVEPRAHEPAPDGELFLYTGGTTGTPKGVVWGVSDLLAMQLYNAYTTVGLTPVDDPDEVVRIAADPSTPRIALLPLAPFMHGTALTSTMNAFLLGGTVVITPWPAFDPVRAYRVMTEHRVTRLVVAGDAIAIPLLDALSDLGVSQLPHLESIVSSGMRFSDATKGRLHSMGAITIGDILASTEAGALAIALTRTVDDLPSRLRLTPGAVVLDSGMNEVQTVVGALGRIAFNSGMPKGYYKDQAKTDATFLQINGKRHVIPGDLVRVQPDLHVELLGRGSSVVNSGGEKVYPTEVEESLMRFPGVLDAVVFGLPDPRWGEVVAAAVAAEDPAELDVGELIAHVGHELAGYKKPRHVLVLPDLDRSPTGKVDLGALRERALQAGARS